MPHSLEQTSFERDIFSVSRLNTEVRAVLEGSFPLLWVEGEISNLARPASGHLYFSLKDNHAQVRCAMFRMKRNYLRFQPENGLQVLVRCRVSLFEGRGEFQLLIEHMEPAGEGALRRAFDELKGKLAGEGLFDSARKTPLPPFPKRIGVITSPQGAVLHDITTVLNRRYPIAEVIVYPVPVQGQGAHRVIADMISLADRRGECDLLILARGGGSLEDLAAFNTEEVARAIHRTKIPLVSAIGHETDFTIADFVADLRAATPTAAAELATPDRRELNEQIGALWQRLGSHAQRLQYRLDSRLTELQQRLERCHPRSRQHQRQQRIDELEGRLTQTVAQHLHGHRALFASLGARLNGSTPIHALRHLKQRNLSLGARCLFAMKTQLESRNQQLTARASRLHTLSPLATLERGYSVTRKLPEGSIVHDSATLTPGDTVETQLARGLLICRVDEIH